MSTPAEYMMFQQRRRDEQLQNIFNMALQAYQMKMRQAEQGTQNAFEERRTAAQEKALDLQSRPKPILKPYQEAGYETEPEYLGYIGRKKAAEKPDETQLTPWAKEGMGKADWLKTKGEVATVQREPKEKKSPALEMLDATIKKIETQKSGWERSVFSGGRPDRDIDAAYSAALYLRQKLLSGEALTQREKDKIIILYKTPSFRVPRKL